MSGIDQTLSEVGALIALLPECKLLGSDFQKDRVILELLVGGRETIAALQSIAEAANARLEPWLDLREASAWGAVRQTLSPSVLPLDQIAHGNLQLVGIHLVWHRTGLMSSPNANILLRRWNAALVE